MKRLVVLLAFFTLLSSQTIAQTYGLDNADSALFTKFRIPDTDLHSLLFNTKLNYYFNKSSTLYPVGQNYDNTNTNLLYSLSPGYYLLQESDNRYLSVNADMNGGYNYMYNKAEGSGINSKSYSKYYSSSMDLTAGGLFRDYLRDGSMFYSVSSSAQLSINDDHSNNSLTDSTRNVVYSGTKYQNYDFSIGIGWGKMRNVTSIVSAIRFQERLKQLNLLNKDLNESTIEELAQQFYREGYFSEVHVRPDKFFWQDVQNTLSRDGVSLAGLNQYADSYIREVPDELRFMRNEGIVGGVNIGVGYSNSYSSAAASVSHTNELLLAEGEAYLEFSHQLDLDSQFDFNISLAGGPTLTRNAWMSQQYAVNAGAGYDYELTDRLVTSINESFAATLQNSNQQQRLIQNDFGVAVNYFVEDNVSFAASYFWDYSTQRVNGFAGSDHIDNIGNSSSVNFGLTYYMSRGMILK